MPVKMQVMSALSKKFGAQQTMFQPIFRCKVTKADLMRTLQKENRYLFGDLVETSKEKIVREKCEERAEFSKLMNGDSIQINKSQTDTESHWILSNKQKNVVRIRSKKKSLASKVRLLIPDVNSKEENNIKDSTSFSVEKNSDARTSQSKLESSQTQNDKRNENESGEKNLPPEILIKNMTTFPYFYNVKKEPNDTDCEQLISISASSDRSKLSIPSVTRILNKTMSDASKLNLELWKQRMILQLGIEGFEKYSQELLLNGKQFHSSIQNYLIQKPYDIPDAVEKSWRSVEHVLKKIERVRAIESHTVHSKLYYRGIVDCVALYEGNLCVIDWKKSDKPKSTIESTFDAPIQVASYIGALNSDENYDFQIQNGLVVVGYTNGDPATVHEINPVLLHKYWRFWLRRLQKYYLDLPKVEQKI